MFAVTLEIKGLSVDEEFTLLYLYCADAVVNAVYILSEFYGDLVEIGLQGLPEDGILECEAAFKDIAVGRFGIGGAISFCHQLSGAAVDLYCEFAVSHGLNFIIDLC